MSRERVLVVVRGHLADLVQALPALRDLRRARLNDHITVLLNEYVSAALEGCPYVDRVLPGFAYHARGRVAEIAHTARLMSRIAGRFDTVIALRWSPTLTPVVAVLSGARVRVGYDRTGRMGKLLTHNLGAEPIETASNRVLNQAPLEALGIETDPSFSEIDWIPEHVAEATRRLLLLNGVASDEPFALIQMSSHWGCGEWHSDKWAALIDHMSLQHGLKVVATGASEWFERAKFESVRRRCSLKPISLLGKTSPAQLFDLARRARLYVGGDGGLAQIALAQRSPAVVLFGIEPMEANGPMPGEERAFTRTLQHWNRSGGNPPPNPHCAFGQSHCHGQFCTEDSSRQRISVAEVVKQVDHLLATAVPA